MNYFYGFSWFMKSANVFSSYILIQLTSGIIILSDTIFQMDLVNQHFLFLAQRHYLIVYYLIPNLITIDILRFFFDIQQFRHIDFEMCVLLVSTIVVVANLFLYCYYGKLATESFHQIADCLYEANWINFSIDQQKCVTFMLMHAQIPLYYHGFGIAVLNLETFSGVRLIVDLILMIMIFIDFYF